MTLRTFAKNWLPPAVHAGLAWLIYGSPTKFVGDYQRFEDASRASAGYDQVEIINRVASATREVIAGRAAMERDGVTFSTMEYPWPLAAALLRQAAVDGALRVLDFGGSLGSTYRQCQPLIPTNIPVAWAIVEQSHYVKTGREQFSTPALTFHESPESAIAAIQPTVLILSSVLPYLPDPHETLRHLIKIGRWSTIILDRTIVWEEADRLTIQHVPKSTYGVSCSYPAWIFNRAKLVQDLGNEMEVIAEFPAISGQFTIGGRLATDRGFIATRRSPNERATS